MSWQDDEAWLLDWQNAVWAAAERERFVAAKRVTDERDRWALVERAYSGIKVSTRFPFDVEPVRPRDLPRVQGWCGLTAGPRLLRDSERGSKRSRRSMLRARNARGQHRGRASFKCPLETEVGAWNDCIGAIAAAILFSPAPAVVATGIDTAHLHTKAPLRDPIRWQLEDAFKVASSSKQNVERVEIAGVSWKVAPRLVKSGWKLENDAGDVVVRVPIEPEVDHPTVIVELGSAALWALGWREAGKLADRICEACVVGEVDLQVTRVDICADFQGWQLTPEDRHLFVTRAKKRGRFSEALVEPKWDDPEWLAGAAKRAAALAKKLQKTTDPAEQRRLLEDFHRAPDDRVTIAEYDAGTLAFTGFAFGMGDVGSRLYNKSREIRKSRKGWFNTIWAKSKNFRAAPGATVGGKISAADDVWRLEFQLRREALKQFLENAQGAWSDLSSWDALTERIDDLWRFLTRKWLRHGTRTKESRMEASRPWAVLQAAKISDNERRADLARVIPEVGLSPAIGSAAGYLTTAAALLLEEQQSESTPDYSATITSILMAAHSKYEERGELLEDVVEQKREAIQRRRAFMERKARSHTPNRHRPPERYRTEEGRIYVWSEEDDRREEMSRIWRAENARQEAERIRSINAPF